MWGEWEGGLNLGGCGVGGGEWGGGVGVGGEGAHSWDV